MPNHLISGGLGGFSKKWEERSYGVVVDSRFTSGECGLACPFVVRQSGEKKTVGRGVWNKKGGNIGLD
ncbi:hypothetical protein CPB83DRAFT_841852, partial [Crepidotus variabilis]